MIPRLRVFVLTLFLTLGLLVVGVYSTFSFTVATAHAADQPPLPVTHEKVDYVQDILNNGDGPLNQGDFKNPPSPICSTATSTASNVNTDCEGTAPHNETTIAVNPTNRLNMIGSANDYELTLTSGGKTQETAYSRAHVTFDGGKTWTTYPISYHGYVTTGDPAVTFDASGTVYLATLGFLWSQGNGCCTNPDVLVAHSTDGGKTWSAPSVVAHGTGSFGSVGIFNDKEYITSWGNGNAIVTWTVFNDGQGGSYISSPIYDSVTHDGGKTWSTPTAISGSASFCIGAQGGTTCDQDQASIPTYAQGNIYVAFLNTANLTTGRDQYLVVKVDPSTGQLVAGPYKVAPVFDGFTDYPINIDGRPTYQDSEFRTWAAGNVTVDPTNAQHVAVVWSDMRNSTLPAPSDPYTAKTNSDVIVSQSTDGGVTWSAPTALTAPGDQFMPWGAYDTSGKLRIGYFDRSYDAANHKYGYTLASETLAGSLQFAFTRISTKLSDPTQGDRWFSSRTANSSFPHPSTFLGDYSGITARPGGGVVLLWTDMRLSVCFGTRCGFGEDAFFASAA